MPDDAATSSRPRWRDIAAWPRWARLAFWLIATRLWVTAAMIAGTYFPKPTPGYWNGQTGNFHWQQLPVRWLDIWGRWDTAFYLSLATEGYPRLGPPGEWAYAAAYFPFLPSLLRGLSTLLGGASVYLVGVVAVNALLVLAVIYLDKLARLDRSPDGAFLVVICTLAYPGSHFLSCVYPESAALFLGVFAVYCARVGLIWPAGIACGLAALTRSSGAVICLPVLYELCRQPDGRLRLRPRVLVLLIPVALVGLYLLFNWQNYGDPLYFVHVQAAWGRKPSFPLEPLIRFDLPLDYHLITLGMIALVWVGIRQRQRPGYLAMAGVNVMLPLSTGMLRGIHRYMASNFPVFFFLADLLERRPGWRKAYLWLGCVALGIYAFKWGQGHHPN